MSKFRFFQKDLNTNIGELALEIVREFYVASKKVAVYSLSHPLSGKAIGRLFLQMGKAYRFKKYVNFHIEGGRLFVLNIELRSSVFSDQIIEYMQLLDIKNILFDSNISMKQLSSFLDRVVNSGPAGIYQNMMQELTFSGSHLARALINWRKCCHFLKTRSIYLLRNLTLIIIRNWSPI